MGWWCVNVQGQYCRQVVHTADNAVVTRSYCFLCRQRGMAQLPDLHVSDSSEAMLSGRKPPFRLLVRAVASDGRKVNIRHAVSEGYVVRALSFQLLSNSTKRHRCIAAPLDAPYMKSLIKMVS